MSAHDLFGESVAEPKPKEKKPKAEAKPKAKEKKPKAKAKPQEPKKPRPRDPIWDAWVEIWWPTGVPASPQSRAAINRQVKDLKDMGAKPEQILQRITAWPDKFDGITCTPEAVVKHWGVLAGAGSVQKRTVQPGLTVDRQPTALERYDEAVRQYINYRMVHCGDGSLWDRGRRFKQFLENVRAWSKEEWPNAQERREAYRAVLVEGKQPFDIFLEGLTDNIATLAAYKLYREALHAGRKPEIGGVEIIEPEHKESIRDAEKP